MPRGYDKSDLNKGLLLSLPFDEGIGTVSVKDVAKPHHPVLQTHAPVWTQLPSGLWVFDFDGTNDWLSCLAASCVDLNFSNTSDFSGVAWIFPTTATKARYILCKMDFVNYRGYYFYLSSDASPSLSLGVGGNATNTSQIIVRSSWSCVGFRRAGTSVRLYVNGRDATNNAQSHTCEASGKNLYMGNSDSLNNQWAGYLWGLRIWNRALSPAEHMEIFNRERDLFGV